MDAGHRSLPSHSVVADLLAARGEGMFKAAAELASALRARGAQQTILFGSLAHGPQAVGPISDVDLLVVMPGVGEERMHRRLSDLPEVTAFPYPLDLFVYTPEEWQRASRTAFVAREILASGVSLSG